MKTLNQLLKVFEDFSGSHGQLNSYGQGDLWEVGMSEEIQYPCLWVQPTQARVIKGQGGFALTNTTFRVFILDRVRKDKANEFEVLSDMNQIGHDLLKNIDQNPTFLNGNFTLNQNDVLMEYVSEKLKDDVSGVFMELSFVSPFNSGCSTPLNS